jgi:hypothetical protein
MERDDFDIRSKLWDLAKLVTGFAIAQAVTLGYQVVNPAFHRAIAPLESLVVTLLVTAIFYAFYFTAVVWCHKRLTETTPTHAKTIRTVSRGQIAIIAASLGVSLLAIVGTACRAL